MTTITVPVSRDSFVPELPELETRKLNWMGKIVSWIRDAENHGCIYKVVVYALAIFSSTLMIVSIVLSPLFIYGFKEYMRQCERDRFDARFETLLKMATEHGRHFFLKGRLVPLEGTIDISLWSSTRKLMIKNLELKKEEAQNLRDIDLLRMVACKDDDFIRRYRLRIR